MQRALVSPASKPASALESAAVASNLSRNDVREEENLLVEAVSLLVQRQRETETWVAEQVWQAQERAAVTERRYAELEARLVDIEDQLNRLLREVEPGRSGADVEERLARLREQVEGLKSGPDGRPARTAQPVPVEPAAPPPPPAFERVERVDPPPIRPARAAATVGGGGQSASFMELLGSTPQDRFGVVLIGLGAIAVLYAILTQLPLR